METYIINGEVVGICGALGWFASRYPVELVYTLVNEIGIVEYL
jgi:hypothetical protein